MRQCNLCKKGSVIRGKRRLLRGHYNPVNQSRKYPNLQWSKVNGKRLMICTACMRNQVKSERTRKTVGAAA